MSPTHTVPGGPGASASSSVGGGDHEVTPTVAPDASTAKTRPESPESLTVRNSPSRTTSPLDSTIAGSRKARSTVAGGPWGAESDPIAKGTSDARPTTRSSITPAARPAGADAPGRDEVVVLRAHRATLDRPARADRAEHGVARGVLALDELDDVHAVALLAHEGGPQRVGQGVGEALAED